MGKYREISLDNIKRYKFEERINKVDVKNFIKEPKVLPGLDGSFFPGFLAGSDLPEFVERCASAYKNGKSIILMMGAHVIKCGLTKYIINMMKDRVLSGVAMNGAGSIHDFEIAMFGQTSEDVGPNLENGTFGMVEDTGRGLSEILLGAQQANLGYGEAVGKYIAENNAEYFDFSIFGNGYKENIPVTVHAGIGTDIIYQHREMSGAAAGEASFRDFKIFSELLKGLNDGGVVILFGSAVILPEIFLKALTIARNTGHTVRNFSTAVFDMTRHYRPQFNVVSRPTRDCDNTEAGRGYYFIGHHEIMMPIFYSMLYNRIK